MIANKNPLLNKFDTPDEVVPFDLIDAKHFEPALKTKIKNAKLTIKKLLANDATTFANTIEPIEKIYDDIAQIGNILFNLNSASTSDKIQKVTQKVSPLLTRFSTKLLLNRRYLNKVEQLYRDGNQTLTDEQMRLLEITCQNMKRNGAALGVLKKMMLVRLQMSLSKLTLRFNDRVLADTNNFLLHINDKKDLLGLPEELIERAQSNAVQKNTKGWLFTLQAPDYIPFMKYAHSRSLREKMYRAYTSRGNRKNANDNNKLIKKIVNLRLRQAKMLGYKHFADFVLEERMASTTLKVNNFINDLLLASKSFAKADLDELSKFAETQSAQLPLMPWDFSFYSEKMKEELFGFDEASIKPYFQLEKIIKGVFELANRLFGISFTECFDIKTYHPDVQVFRVFDSDGSYLSVLYLDLYARDNKQGGAWMTEYRAQSNIGENMKRPHISICCNFAKPTANQPTLLSFNDAGTYLHEFGHALHGMLANTVYPSLSGTNVFRDFVELPSQIFENWLCEPLWLQDVAVHYKTGEAIPDELIDKLIVSRNFQAGYQSVRQLSFAMLDMAWHSIGQPFKGDVGFFEKQKTLTTKLLPDVEGSCTSTSFGHIFGGGYAAGYYGYKWAEVLDADAFAMFKENGIFDAQTALAFRKEILEKGGTVDPNTLYHNFRKKEPTIDALLERSGLKSN
ncbi:MAG TPA: M3 family metallopeptidase [Prolixibacteraceae bacterium]|nr:M3 family metallopeptidase [Prolixibacteraceae bacterium]HPR59503.1 M3 family metallopeptidase [Prolixibacteraceae bacterium]